MDCLLAYLLACLLTYLLVPSEREEEKILEASSQYDRTLKTGCRIGDDEKERERQRG